MDGIGLSLLLGRLLALLAPGAFTDMGQVFQPDQAMGMRQNASEADPSPGSASWCARPLDAWRSA
jgi:hypothetical protein